MMLRTRTWSTAAALLLAVTAAAGCTPPSQRVTITIFHSTFDSPALSVPAGVPITFVLVNEDPIDHEWLIGDAAFHEAHRSGTHAVHGAVPTEVTVPALETRETIITFDERGTLTYVCHLPGHEAYGMVGTLSVH